MCPAQEDYITKFTALTNGELLHALAFEWEDYTNEAQVALTSAAEQMGISEQDVWDYRAKAFAGSEVLTHCTKCGEELRLNSDDLSTGSFECPECGWGQKVTFAALKVKGAKSPIAERLTQGAFADDEELKGIGGWLYLVGAGIVLAAIVSAVRMAEALSTGDLSTGAMYVVDVTVLVALLYLFVTERKLFPKAIIIVLVLGALFALLDALWLGASAEGFRDDIIEIIRAAIWIPYFIVSKRVKATFTKRLWTRQPSEQESEQPSTASTSRTNLRKIIAFISYVGWIGCAVVLWFFYLSALTEWLGYIGTVLAFVAAPGVIAFPIIYWIVEGHFPVLYFVLIGLALFFGFIAGAASPDD